MYQAFSGDGVSVVIGSDVISILEGSMEGSNIGWLHSEQIIILMFTSMLTY